MTTISYGSETERPTPVVAAVALSAISSVVGLAFILTWPDLEDRAIMFGVTLVLTSLLFVALWFLWSGSRWGAVAALMLNALNVLLAVPGFFSGDPGLIAINAIYTAASMVTVVLLLSATSRAFWGGK